MLNQEDLDDFVLAQKAKSTSYKDTSDLNVFRRFCSTVKETREIENIPPAELNALLSNFFVKAVKRDGDLYEPDTLSGIRNSLQRVLVARGVNIDLRKDKDFEKCRNVLAARRKQLTKLGKGNKPNACRALEGKGLYQIKHLPLYPYRHFLGKGQR